MSNVHESRTDADQQVADLVDDLARRMREGESVDLEALVAEHAEHAEGRHGILDHHTDVYSLGVTLYELLTLQPAFPGDDRRRLLRDLSEADPQPPRQLNRSIPIDLETIVAKATSKEPTARYATAQELADDLERFLDEKPIHAQRPTLLSRAAKWCRRH